MKKATHNEMAWKEKRMPMKMTRLEEEEDMKR